jgi:hypothetical protein
MYGFLKNCTYSFLPKIGEWVNLRCGNILGDYFTNSPGYSVEE